MIERLGWLGYVLFWYWPLVACCLLSAFLGALAMWVWCLAQVAPIS